MNTNIQLRRQCSLINLNALKKEDRRRSYSLNNNHYLNSLLCDYSDNLEWDEMDLVELSETDKLSDYDIDEYFNFNEFDFEMINFHQEDTESLSMSSSSSTSSISILKNNELISYDYIKSYYRLFDILKTSIKSKSVASLVGQNTKKYLCLKSKHSSLLNLNENIKYCLIKKQQKKKDSHIRFFRFNKIIIYFGRLMNKFKSIIYRKRQKIRNNVNNLLLIDMIDDEALKSYDIID